MASPLENNLGRALVLTSLVMFTLMKIGVKGLSFNVPYGILIGGTTLIFGVPGWIASVFGPSGGGRISDAQMYASLS